MNFARRTATISFLMLLAVCNVLPFGNAAAPPFLEADRHQIRSTHALRYRITLPARFRATAVDTRRDRFNGHPFDISRAALIDDNAAVMIHAEVVADGSGASNYDDLPLATLDDQPFRTRPSSCQQLSDADIAGESDLEWLTASGFSPTGPLAVAQYLASTPDHNAEIVITLMVRVDHCPDAAAALAGLAKKLLVDRREE